MEFVARKSDLLRELALLQGCATPNPHLPILSHVWLEAEDGHLRFAATDLQVGLRTGCPATVTTPGVLALPARSFLQIVQSFPDTDVKVVANKNGATVSADKYDGHMVALPAADFPDLPDAVSTPLVTLERAALRELIGKVWFATSADDTRYFLNGALLIILPTSLTMVATDGHRLAIVTKARPEPADPAEQDGPTVRTLLSKKTLAELGRLIADPSEPTCTYASTPSHLFFHVATTRPAPTPDDGARMETVPRLLIARIVDATFPAYDRVIPTELPLTLEFNREKLATALRRVAILADGRTRAVKLTFTKNRCEVSATDPQKGESSEPLPVDYTPAKKKGEALTMCFNAQDLLEGLAACGTDAVSMSLKDDREAGQETLGSQVVLKPVGPVGFDYTYVVMPMRV